MHRVLARLREPMRALIGPIVGHRDDGEVDQWMFVDPDDVGGDRIEALVQMRGLDVPTGFGTGPEVHHLGQPRQHRLVQVAALLRVRAREDGGIERRRVLVLRRGDREGARGARNCAMRTCRSSPADAMSMTASHRTPLPVGVDQCVHAAETILVEVVVRDDVDAFEQTGECECMEGDLCRQVVADFEGVGLPGQCERVNRVASFAEPSTTTFASSSVR